MIIKSYSLAVNFLACSGNLHQKKLQLLKLGRLVSYLCTEEIWAGCGVIYGCLGELSILHAEFC